jgi:hypothetical protein
MARSATQRMTTCCRLGATLLVAVLPACVTVEGESSGDMKARLQSTYLYTSIKRFYPDGVPADPATVYPRLDGRSLRAIEAELQALSTFLVERHGSRRGALEVLFKQPPAPAPKPRFVVERTLQPTAFSSPQGEITIDVRVLQAVFRGALISNGGSASDRLDTAPVDAGSNAASSPAGRVDPDLQTEHQRKLIQSAVDLVRQIDQTRGQSMLGDLVGVMRDDGFDSPWFRMSDLMMKSQRLQVTYSGAVLFLMAHEMGHIALGHHRTNTLLQKETPESQRTDGSRYCEQRRELEFEADAYALVLLTQTIGETALVSAMGMNMFGQDDISGYDSFFRYGYPLAGFEGSGSHCTYPTAVERRELLAEGEATLREGARELLDERMNKAINDKLKTLSSEKTR